LLSAMIPTGIVINGIRISSFWSFRSTIQRSK